MSYKTGGPKRPKRTGLDRIQDGDRAEEAIANLIGDKTAEQAAVGFFAGGKMIVATQAWQEPVSGDNILRLQFNDGSLLQIKGQFEMTYRAVPVAEYVEVSFVKDALVEAGNQLMSGDVVEGKVVREEG